VWDPSIDENDSGNSRRDLAARKKRAAARHISLRQFITEAVAEKLQAQASDAQSERLAWAGELRHLS